MRFPPRTAAQLVSACLAVGALAGCQSAGTASTTPPTISPSTVATTTPVTTGTAPVTPAPTSTTTAKGRRSTSGEEQMKDACAHGRTGKAECDRFFELARRDGVRFSS